MRASLAGRRLLVTRRPEQSGALAALLRERGATVVELPTLALAPPADPAPLDAALRSLAGYDWLALTSANAATALAARLTTLGLPPPERLPRGATVGAATSAAARSALPWLSIDLEPARDFRAQGLLAAFEACDLAGRRVLLPLSERARDVLAEGLRARGAAVDAPVAYRNLAPPGLRAAFEQALSGGLDLLLFASPSSVENLREAAADLLAGRACAVIGPVTERAARAAGLEVQAVAEPSTVEGLVHALDRRFGL